MRDVLLLSQNDAPDAFRQFHARIGRDGTLLKDGRPSHRPVLVEEYLGKAALQDATRVRTTLMSTLWRPNGNTRLSWLARGRYFDGWLASHSSITIWPDTSGRTTGVLKLRFYLPADSQGGSVRLEGTGVDRVVQVARGGRQTVEVPVNTNAALDVAASGACASFPRRRQRRVCAQLPADLRARPSQARAAFCR